MRILIFTKNVLAEKNTQQKLQTLGHEVFVTKKYLQSYLEDRLSSRTISQFHICIISKTISDYEAREIFYKFNNQPYVFFREVEEIPEVAAQSVNDSYCYVKENASMVELREAIANTI